MAESADAHTDVVVVSYFGARDVESLIDSVRRQQSTRWRVWIVDNSENVEENRRLERLVATDARARVLTPHSNLGYFGGAQFALDVIGPEAGTVIVSNADIVVSDASLIDQVNVLADQDPDLAVIAPAIISQRTGKDQNPHLAVRPTVRQQRRRMRRMLTPWLAQLTLLAALLKRSALDLIPRDPPASQRRYVYAPHGSFIVFLPRYFEQGGNFAHPTFLFGEELTVAEFVRRQGLKVLYAPQLRVSHVEHGQMGFIRSRRVLSEMVRAARYGYRLIAAG